VNRGLAVDEDLDLVGPEAEQVVGLDHLQ